MSADGSKWARIAVRATEAKCTLLQIGLLDRRIWTLFIADDSKPVERIPTGEELQKQLAEIEVTDGRRDHE